jgi:hypothetical protein
MRRDHDNGGDGRVAELQGIYGPYAFPEKLLQKIWLLGMFETRGARLIDGTVLDVLAPGRWNLLGGPDFRGARLRIGGREVTGDIEVHFQAADWVRHGHDLDPAYGDVILHVVLFEPRRGVLPPRTVNGREVAQLVLLPWLHCSLEEFAADDAVEALTQQQTTRLAEALLELEPEMRQVRLRTAAEKRWKQKVHFAEVRIARLGWTEACHHTALEILGYRFNRAPMLAVAERFPLVNWLGHGASAAELWAAGGAGWQRQGVRPANNPRRRLEQYRAWVTVVPDWPERLRQWADSAALSVSEAELSAVAQVRRDWKLAAWRDQVAERICGGALSGPRLDTLIGNGLLPLLAAQTGCAAFARWFCGGAGEVAPTILKALRLAGVCGAGAAPRHEGAVQGLLQLGLERPDGFASVGADRSE